MTPFPVAGGQLKDKYAVAMWATEAQKSVRTWRSASAARYSVVVGEQPETQIKNAAPRRPAASAAE
ncbi:MAG: hypothetical protein JJ964_13960 [Rhizobiales bacterium]|nr:hypothetical protein [Hyphomicrobiales bacterium]